MAATPVFIGLSGLATGEVFKLGPAADVLVGRSRECQISFQWFHAWLALSEIERRLRDHFNSAVSRKHLRLLTHGSVVTAENLSSTGTMIDQVALDGRKSYDLLRGPMLIRLGSAEERFSVELMDEDEADRRIAALPVIDHHRLPGVPSPADDPTPQGNPTLPPVSRPGNGPHW